MSEIHHVPKHLMDSETIDKVKFTISWTGSVWMDANAHPGLNDVDRKRNYGALVTATF